MIVSTLNCADETELFTYHFCNKISATKMMDLIHNRIEDLIDHDESVQ
jgi:hypothetical protein